MCEACIVLVESLWEYSTMHNIKELKIGRYLIKVGEFPDGFRFNIFTHDKSLFDKGVEATEI